MDSATDVYICNDLRLMTHFTEKLTRVKKSTADGFSPERRNDRIRLALEDGSEGLIFNLRNIFYVPNSLSNLVSLGLPNDTGVYYDNERQALYDKISQKPLVFAQN